ncbi:MAG: DUF5915 domain-containing protein, partial [Alloscardovia omnicolens]|nr:DUF5915 domain-containing protein [Alloscardovia omnicolens]
VVSSTLSLRKAQKIRVRQPLAQLTVVADNVDAVREYEELLESELNVKQIQYTTLENAGDHGLRVVNELRVNARAAGPRLGKNVQFAIRASKSGAWHVNEEGMPVVDAQGVDGGIGLVEGEYELISRVEAAEGGADEASSVSASLPTGGFVLLDTTLTDDLLAEGYARDAIRSVQDARKAADLDISDRISLVLTAPAADADKLKQFEELISTETLATSFSVNVADVQELEVKVEKA